MATADPLAPPRRFPQLDAVRGLAAVGVLTYHLYVIALATGSIPPWALWLLTYSPLHIVLTGKTTLLFFILSGFVLSYPHFIDRAPRYAEFVLKRVLRLYTPYLVGITTAVGLLVASGGPVTEPLPGFRNMWTFPWSAATLAGHVVLIGPFNVSAYDPPIWSLVQEIRLSLAIPLIVWIVSIWRWPSVLALGLGCSLAAGLIDGRVHAVEETWYKTLSYMLMFLIGALIARHLPALRARYARLTRPKRLGLMVLGMVSYTYASLLLDGLLLHSYMLGNVVTCLGACLAITLALTSDRISALLQARPLLAIGRWPYGIYLYHMPLFYFAARMWAPYIGLAPALAIAVVETFALAIVSRRCIEQPVAAFAARWTKRLRECQTPPALSEAA